MSRRNRRTLLGSGGRKNRADTPAPPPETPAPDENTGPTDGPEMEPTDGPHPLEPLPDPDTQLRQGPPRQELGPTLVPSDSMQGERIAEWVIDEELGASQGCMVVRAHHHKSERMKATLKILSDRWAQDVRARERLVHEGEVLFPLEHPNILTVRNLRLAQDPPFLEFELTPGERLDQIVERRGAMFMAEALDLVEQLLATLNYLHGKGIAHRDVQPHNILVRPDGGLTLVGFAYAVEGEASEQDAPNTALPYVPPEWPEERARSADLYATGVLLYELLTGERAFDIPMTGGPITTAMALQQKSQAPFLDPGARFHEDLRAMVRQLTSKEPAGRFADAALALNRLQSVERRYASG